MILSWYFLLVNLSRHHSFRQSIKVPIHTNQNGNKKILEWQSCVPTWSVPVWFKEITTDENICCKFYLKATFWFLQKDLLVVNFKLGPFWGKKSTRLGVWFSLLIYSLDNSKWEKKVNTFKYRIKVHLIGITYFILLIHISVTPTY